jgi:hypothetical protein
MNAQTVGSSPGTDSSNPPPSSDESANTIGSAVGDGSFYRVHSGRPRAEARLPVRIEDLDKVKKLASANLRGGIQRFSASDDV